MDAPRRGEHLDEHAVDAVADRGAALEGLDVDVARAVLGRAEHDAVDEPDDRRFVVGVEEVGNFEAALVDVDRVAGLETLDEALIARRRAIERAGDALAEHGARDDHRIDLAAEVDAKIAERTDRRAGPMSPP